MVALTMKYDNWQKTREQRVMYVKKPITLTRNFSGKRY